MHTSVFSLLSFLLLGLLSNHVVLMRRTWGAVGELMQLSKKVIDLDELRMLAAQGVPDGAGVRSTVWKVPDRHARPFVLSRFVL